ncbi:hypothetical protein H0H92_012092 [Tricholoma furcatifolium]|nr:hypothetical protein H0H92_012092 [Tricholoma furcatifolium]
MAAVGNFFTEYDPQTQPADTAVLAMSDGPMFGQLTFMSDSVSFPELTPGTGSHDWTQEHLMKYKITFQDDNFLDVSNVSLEDIDPVILRSTVDSVSDLVSTLSQPTTSPQAASYLDYLYRGTHPEEKSEVDHFIVETLQLLHFDERHTILTRDRFTKLDVGGQSVQEKSDVCLLHSYESVLMQIIHNFGPDGTNAELQVIGNAIAALSWNKQRRSVAQAGAQPRLKDVPRLDSIMMPCIIMTGTRPTFYLVPVSTKLSNALSTGTRPQDSTTVLRCAVATENLALPDGAGMENIEYRQLAFKYLRAFKTVAKKHWERNVAGLP